MRSIRSFFTLMLLAATGCAATAPPESPESPSPGADRAMSLVYCPDCGGRLARVGTIHDDQTWPSNNLAVWDRSICGNPSYGTRSVICTTCWLAYLGDN